MFNKMIPTYKNFKKADTLIGKKTSCEGVLDTSDSIRIDGKFRGEIKTNEDLVIGENGQVEAVVEANRVLIEGTLNGNIVAKGKVELASTGKLYGDILIGNLVIKEGAIFNGNCNIQNTNCITQISESEKNEEKPGC